MIKRPTFAINHAGGTLHGLVLQERHQRDNQVTAHAVDAGAPVTDHIRSEQNSLTLSVLFTDLPVVFGTDAGMDWSLVDLPLDIPQTTPVFSPGTALAAGVGAVVGAVGGLLGVPGLAGPSAKHLDWAGKDYLAEAWDALAAIRDDRELVQVVTSTVTYDDVALRSFSWSRSNDSTTATAELAFVALTKATTVSVPLFAVASLPAAPKKTPGKVKLVPKKVEELGGVINRLFFGGAPD